MWEGVGERSVEQLWEGRGGVGVSGRVVWREGRGVEVVRNEIFYFFNSKHRSRQYTEN